MQVANVFISNGTIGRDPEVTQTPNGLTILKFSVAVNHKSGNEDHTDWYNIASFGRQAETLMTLRDGGSLTKGARVDVIGRLTHRPYKGRDGSDKMSIDVNASDVILVSPPRGYNPDQSVGQDDDLSQVPF